MSVQTVFGLGLMIIAAAGCGARDSTAAAAAASSSVSTSVASATSSSASPPPPSSSSLASSAAFRGSEVMLRAEVPAKCDAHPYAPAKAGTFRHKHNALLAAAAEPEHAAQDVLVVEGAAVVLEGKLAYGKASKDLEDEPVRVRLDTCAGWEVAGEGDTDGDGRVRVVLERPPPAGTYALRFEVAGDGSFAAATLFVRPRGTHLVVTDLDGTMTTSDEELVKDVEADLFRPLLGGDYVPALYPAGPALTAAHTARGTLMVYLTGRPYWLTKLTREWVAASGFARGVLHTTDSNAEALTRESGVGDYKKAFLQRLLRAGFVVDAAYGNAATDVYAYSGAGLPPERTWIIGPHGGERGTHAVKGSWEGEVARVKALPPP
jgi:phosphatidate phosphatase APP1